MRQGRVRRLPVLDSQGSLVGMLSLADLAREAARQRSQSNQEISDAEVSSTLAAICSSSTARPLHA